MATRRIVNRNTLRAVAAMPCPYFNYLLALHIHRVDLDMLDLANTFLGRERCAFI